MNLVLVAYDVPEDKRRRRIAKALERLGTRVQYSVFSVRGTSAAAIAATLEPLIEPAEDNVRIQVVCARCEGGGLLLGRAGAPILPAAYRIY